MAVRHLNVGDNLVEIGARHGYEIGDLVLWATASTAGEYTFIGHPKGDKKREALMLAIGAVGKEDAFPVDTSACAPTGFRDQELGRKYRERYLQRHPNGLEE